jgi:myo-inositol-1(or 4)-monophosphatase
LLIHQGTIDTFYKASFDACREVYELLEKPLCEDDLKTDCIGAGGDLSMLIDVKAEKIFFSYFESFACIDSEEYGLFGSNDYKVVLDPIDGSDNFVSRFPYYGASMALQYKDETIAALVCNMANGDIFYRLGENKPRKASLHSTNDGILEVNQHTKVGIFEKSALFTEIIDKLIENKLKFRSPGAVALSLVYAFNSKYMIFLGSKRSFDLEAGLFITADLPRYESDNVIIIAQNEETLAKIKAIVIEGKI